MKKLFTAIFFATLVVLNPAFAAEMEMSESGHTMEGGMEQMEYMVPFHIAEIVIALVAIWMVWSVITATGQKTIFIYLVIGLGFFAVGSIIGYSPHLGWMHDHDAEFGEVIVNTIGLALIGISFYKWKKMLG